MILKGGETHALFYNKNLTFLLYYYLFIYLFIGVWLFEFKLGFGPMVHYLHPPFASLEFYFLVNFNLFSF